jgi:hypothetical protein
MTNLYHIYATPPAITREAMIIELERLAEQLVQSGRLRIDAGERVNFVRLLSPSDNISKVFSKRELEDAALLPVTRRVMGDVLARKIPDASERERAIESEITRLKRELTKHLLVEPETEMQVARLVVQATHPAVMMLMLWEEVEVFVNFGHTVGEVLDVEDWQRMGKSSGLQSTAGRRDYCVYISAGGNPFLTGEYIRSPHEGPAAMARILVIGGQEMGHFADILRDPMGRPVARHSADIGVRRASDVARRGRKSDQANVARIKQTLESLGLAEVQEADRAVEFYRKNRPKDPVTKKSIAKAAKLHKRLIKQAEKHGMGWVGKFPHQEDMGEKLVLMLGDMKFNLAPIASAYQRDDPEEEDAIACAEALARVPQQVNKWGHHCTRALYPALYQLYYGQVIAAVVQCYEAVSGHKYRFTYTRLKKPKWQQYLDLFTKRWQGWFDNSAKTAHKE